MLCLRGLKKDILLAWWSHLMIASVFTFFFSQIYCTVYINIIYIYISIYSKQWCHLSFSSLTRPIRSWAITIFAVCAVVQCFQSWFFRFLSRFTFSPCFRLFVFFCFFLPFMFQVSKYKLKCWSVVNHISLCFSYSCVAIISVTFVFLFLIPITRGWKVSALMTQIKCQTIIFHSSFTLKLISRMTQKSDCLRFKFVTITLEMALFNWF